MSVSLNEEKKLWRKGYKLVAGADEVGRGCIAGPVVAAAVLLKTHQKIPFPGIKDSKKLSIKKREEFYKILIKYSQIEWGIGVVSEKIIDKINILEATKLAIQKAVNSLKFKIDFLIIDGNFKINLLIPQKSIIKGDEKVFSCAAASIIAKVTRDKIMKRYHKKYPCFGFDKNKGYLTKFHLEQIKKNSFCPIHRKTFAPLK